MKTQSLAKFCLCDLRYSCCCWWRSVFWGMRPCWLVGLHTEGSWRLEGSKFLRNTGNKLPYNTMPCPRGLTATLISFHCLCYSFLKCLVLCRGSNQFKKFVEITIGIYYWWDTTGWYRISRSFLSTTGTQCEPVSVTLWINSLRNSQITSSILINFHSKTFYHTVLYQLFI